MDENNIASNLFINISVWIKCMFFSKLVYLIFIVIQNKLYLIFRSN